MSSEPAAWDRTVDVVWPRKTKKRAHDHWAEDIQAFSENSRRLRRENGAARDMSRYFRLPSSIRYMVMQEILDHHDSGKPIRLSSPQFYAPIWTSQTSPNKKALSLEEYFDSLAQVLEGIRPYTRVCPAMAADILAALCMIRRFHVVYSPYTTEGTQKAATLWMDKYGPLMKCITVEVDLAKLAGGSSQAASELDMEATLRRPRRLIQRFSERQQTRRRAQIGSLVVLVRRYYGLRPSKTTRSYLCGATHGSDLARPRSEPVRSRFSILPKQLLADKEVDFPQELQARVASMAQQHPDNNHSSWGWATSTASTGDRPRPRSTAYCDDSNLHVLDPIADIRNIVSVRMIGITRTYAEEFFNRLSGGEHHPMSSAHHHNIASSLYPFTPGQESYVNFGRPRGTEAVRHVVDKRGWKEACSSTGPKGVILAPLPFGYANPRRPPTSEHPALRRKKSTGDYNGDGQRDGGERQMGKSLRKTISMISLRRSRRD
ncbi:hypothetical protein GQ53DRAFT_832229 [Thozetella sp. PMI_491]|nr:hypothetical protein GQ53DRAFT_832229 [Thozetella sp. PMI_491]